jgi:hypothetical protein
MKHDNDLPTTDTTEIKLLIDRVKQGKLDQGDAQLIEKLLSFLLTLINLLHGKNTPMRRLKELLFGLKKRTSNKSQADKKDEQQESSPGSKPPTGDGTSKESASTEACEEQATIKPAKRARKPGHGRRPASDYTGARVVRLDHPELLTGDPCPEPGCEGQLHQLKQPQVTIYLRGQPVINATKYERPLLRCSDCVIRRKSYVTFLGRLRAAMLPAYPTCIGEAAAGISAANQDVGCVGGERESEGPND